MKVEEWLEVAKGVRARGGAVTPSAIRQEVIDTGFAAEVLAEQAATLSRLGNALDRAVLRLAEIRAAREAGAARESLLEEDRAARAELHRLRWEMTVVKEAIGTRGIRADLDRCWPVPPPLG